MENKFKIVGKVKDAQGLKGEIFVRLFADEHEWLEGLKEVRLTKGPEIKTLTLQKVRPHKNGLVFKMFECNDRTEAEKWKGFDFEIPESLLVSRPGESIYLQEVMNFLVTDKSHGQLGLVHGFKSTHFQDHMLIRYKEREVMIPFVRDLILNIDFANRTIDLDLPDGLLEL